MPDSTCGYEDTTTDKPCQNPATGDDGYCWLKSHSDDGPDGESDGRGAAKGNDWAAKHGAYSESFMSGFLTEKEQARVRDAMEVLEVPEGAQAHARLMAAIAAEQFKRTGDDRFLRRYESICDKFGIAPADEVELSGELDLHGDGFEFVFNEQ